MRMTAAEAANFPELAAMAYQVSLEGSVRCISEALSSFEVTPSDAYAKRFVELVMQPAAFKALYGADVQTLLNRISDAIKLMFPDGFPDI